MSLQSPEFLFWFFPVVLTIFYVTSGSARKWILIVASYFFYGWWNPLCVPLLFLSAVWNYLVGKNMHVSLGSRRKAWFATGIVINLGILGFFKYEDMFATTVNTIARRDVVPLLSLALPLGISFFTFEGISYLIDIYRRTSAPARNMTDFVCFLSFFPHLIAGPIIRFNDIEQQLQQPALSWDTSAEGAYRFVLGLSKKLLLADTLARVADLAFAASHLSSEFAWTGLLAYGMQIYLDFSAYSDMAIGLGLLLGIRLPENFRQPYLSTSITEFWQRWHITLSQWMRDYLYIPLGGNRRGLPTTVRNLLVTLLVAGLWHGARWTFVLWGAYYGILLGLERIAAHYSIRLVPHVLKLPVTFLLVTLGWVLFRTSSFTAALRYYRALIPSLGVHASGAEGWMLIVIAAAYGFLILERFVPVPPQRFPWYLKTGMVCLLLSSVLVAYGAAASPFLYFQF